MAKKSSSTRRLLIWTGILLAVLVVGGFGARAAGLIGSGDKATEVDTEVAVVRNVTQIVTASGKVQPEVEVKISPDVSGEIIELRVREGDQVQQGQLLARIKPDFYAAQVEQAQAGVLQAQANLAQRSADRLKAEIDLKRQKELYDKKVVAESEYQTAQTQYDMAKASYEAAEYGVQSAQAQLREVREQLAKTTIFAPMTGTISQLNVELGERVVGTSQMAGTELLRIAKLEQMEMEIDVNENDVVNVGIGDTASVEVDAYPNRTFKGVVTEIANSARITGAGTQEQVTNFPVKVRILGNHSQTAQAAPAEGAGGVTRREVPFSGDVAAAVLRPGMSGTVDVFTQTAPGAVAIPIQAVTIRDYNKLKEEGEEGDVQLIREEDEETEDLRKVVFVMEDGKAKMVQVETGISDETHVVVTSGLRSGQAVIVGPFSAVSRSLEPDAPVTVEEDEKKKPAKPRAETASK